MSEKTQAEILKEELFAKQEHASYTCEENEIAVADEFCEGYKKYLDEGKTEREALKISVEMAKAKGFREYKLGDKISKGDKLYYNNRGKNLSGSRLYVALFPCNECAKAIIQAGIREVVYLSDKYHDTPSTTASRRMLESAGVKCSCFKPTKGQLVLSFTE